MDKQIDFLGYSLEECDNFIRNSCNEFGEEHADFKGFDKENDKPLSLPHGFAVVGKKPYGLVLKYIYAAIRNEGTGSRLIELARHVDPTKDLWLVCYGETRREWFAKRGFTVDPSKGAGFRMVSRSTNPNSSQS
jgi:hypothetical protein